MSTTTRMETKFVVRTDQIGPLLERLHDRMGPPKICEVRSAYFDGPTDGLARLAVLDPRFHVTVRSREYDPDEEARNGFSVWLEVKVRQGERCVKSRREMEPSIAGEILASRDLYVLVAELRQERVLQETRLHEALRPFAGRPGARAVGVVACRRIAYEDEAMRVTLDLDLSFHPPPEGLYRNGRGLRGGPLPTPWFREPAAILEAKWNGSGGPDGLTQALSQVEYSKFVRLVRERGRRLVSGGAAC